MTGELELSVPVPDFWGGAVGLVWDDRVFVWWGSPIMGDLVGVAHLIPRP